MREPAGGVVVLGQIARDLVLVVDSVPGPGGSVEVVRRRELLGGKGANIAVGLAQLGARVAVVGVVGDDAVGNGLVAQLERDHVGVSGVRRRAGVSTALMVDVVTADGQWRYLESVADEVLLTVGDVHEAQDLLGSASAVVLQLQQPAAAVLAALDLVPPGCRVVLDGVLEDRDASERVLAAATVVRMDAREAELFAGRPLADVSAARVEAQRLLERGPELVVIAFGERGNLLCSAEGDVLIPLVDSAEAVDTTGGGDSFVAALTWALGHEDDPERAGRLATVAAGLTVTHPGGRPALSPNRIEAAADRAEQDSVRESE